VGYDEKCAYRILNVRVSAEGTLFDLRLPFGVHYYDIELKLVGKHFAYNAAFAVAAAHILGVEEKEIREGLSSYTSCGMRMNISEKNGITVLADCYNAAPESMRAALETLKTISVSGKRIAVLGDMRELGAASDEMHKRVGGFVARNNVDLLFTLGESGAIIADGAMDAGMSYDRVCSVTDQDGVEALARMIAERAEKGDAILFKASRGMALERVMTALFDVES
jgi:UDP-N-acetylmuramoyl-tripeptide--D-alanyl-D-alanine ligase